jgi:hypothetical protein
MDTIYSRLNRETCKNCDKRIFAVCREATPATSPLTKTESPQLKQAAG